MQQTLARVGCLIAAVLMELHPRYANHPDPIRAVTERAITFYRLVELTGWER